MSRFDSSMHFPKGKPREARLKREVYFSDAYFSLNQLCSFAHQINHLHALGGRSILEIGMGNGFTSLYLRMSGIDVTTVDINSHLMPDICCDLEHLPSKLNKQFDVVSCCEVLEHMPWESFANNIGILSNYAPTLFLTLPYGKRIMGYGGFAFFSKNMIKSFWLDVPLFKKNLAPGHFWELNHSSLTSTKSIIRVLREHYCSVKSGNFELNPYHRYFICKR